MALASRDGVATFDDLACAFSAISRVQDLGRLNLSK